MSGRVVVVEGLDGTGKSTASVALAAALAGHWTTTPCLELRAVRPSFDAAFARCPTARSLAYAASVLAVGADAASRRLRGEVVVIDRYWLSTVTHAPDDALGALAALEGLVQPADLTLYLVAPLAVRARRLHGREELTSHDEATLSAAEDRRLDRRYRSFAQHPAAGRFVEVDASGSAAETLRAMAREVERWVRPQVALFGEAGGRWRWAERL